VVEVLPVLLVLPPCGTAITDAFTAQLERAEQQSAPSSLLLQCSTNTPHCL
jgi:hypothetical protein